MITGINNEDRLVQQTFADHLRDVLGWETVYAWNDEMFGDGGTLGRDSERDVVLVRDLRQAIARLNPQLPPSAVGDAAIKLTQYDFARSIMQHNRELYGWMRDGVPVEYRDDRGALQKVRARVFDFRNPENNRYVAVRELKIQGLRVPHYNRRADIVCFVNGLPLVFIELKAVYVNIRAGYDGNLSDYRDTIPHAFYHNAFLVVSNGDRAKYGSVSSGWEHFHEWKRLDERDCGSLQAQVLLDGMLAKDRLLDLVESFILFDESRAGATRKVVARNHQVLGVNKAVDSVRRQETLKLEIPRERRLVHRATAKEQVGDADTPLLERAHPDLGRLGVFWHTQGSGKSYSMLFFTEKVRRTVPGNFTFVVMTDREDLDDQIYRTFVGCGAVDPRSAARAGSGEALRRILTEDHRYVFSLIHKFNQDVTPETPYSDRDDIIVISDEAHRTQAGKLARNMRMALPNAAFIGFTGTPLFKHDHLTRRIFGGYVSRYDFKRSEDDGATVKLVYENRGEKLGITRLDLNDRIAAAIEQAELDADQMAHLEKLLGKDYEVITAGDRLDKIADDFVDHCSARWQSGKSLMVCVDKVTCGRMHQRIVPRWTAKIAELEARERADTVRLSASTDDDEREKLIRVLDELRGRLAWMRSTIVEIIISEAQGEVAEFAKWGVDIKPHRRRMKMGFETADGRRVDVETAFKDPSHPFRVAIVCAMWLTGFDVECLSTLYIDKPMKAHNLMQAIARANRVYPGKACGVIVDYNGMLKSLRAALAQYALGDEDGGDGTDDNGTAGGAGSGEGGGITITTEELLASYVEAIDAAEAHLVGLGFEPAQLNGTKGFARIELLRQAVNALYTSDEAKRRYEIMTRELFARQKPLIGEPATYPYAERHDNVEAIYKKLAERRDMSDVTAVLKALHRIINDAIAAQGPGTDHAEGLTVDLSQVDFQRLKEEFARKVKRKALALKDIRDVVEDKLAAMLAQNPERMDYYRKYQEIVADYNREKDRATVEETFARLMELARTLDDEQRRAVEEGLTEEELALFDLIFRADVTKADRERLKQASKELLAKLRELLKSMEHWTQNARTQAEVETAILDHFYLTLPRPPFTDEETQRAAKKVFEFVWQRSESGFAAQYA
jgi:type I restriction enzyme R subunit